MKISTTEQKQYVFTYFLRAALNFALSFILEDCQTRWQTVEDFDAILNSTFLKTR